MASSLCKLENWNTVSLTANDDPEGQEIKVVGGFKRQGEGSGGVGERRYEE